MKFEFNSLNRIEPPKIALCRVDTQMLGFLNPTNIVIKPTFCSVTELTFTVYEGTNFYDSVRKYMVLEVDGFGRFEISDSSETNDGNTRYKEVTAQSYEVSLNAITLTFKDDQVYSLWDPINPEKTLLGIISSQTGWTIAHVDVDLLIKMRTLSIDNEQVYGLLMGDIADAFKCYFVFDTMAKTISCYQRDGLILNSGVNLSFRNLIEEMNISESSEEITTALTVVGAEGTGINLVNPLGNNVIYNFGYFMTDKPWGMPLDLQDAVNEWLQKIEDNRVDYADLVTRQRDLSIDITTLDGELRVLQAEHKALLDAQSVAIAGDNNERLRELYPLIQEKESQISTKEAAKQEKESERERCIESKSAITTSLSFKNNFTDEQYEILKYYIKGMVYENENFVFTSIMTEAEKINIANQLYEQGQQMARKLSVPLCEFEVKVPGFLFNKGYELFAKSLELGTAVNLELEPDVWVEPTLLQVVIDYDNPDSTTIVLSDNFRLMGDVYEFSRGYTESVKASRKTSMSAPLWDEPLRNGFYSTVGDYINNALNLANQEIINASNQEFTMGSYGLRGKMYDEESDSYDPHQVAMTNNVIAFTDNNWQSTRAALGRVTIGTTEYYGLVAEAIIGNLIAGEQLTISNTNNSFVLNSSGATLTNADFTVVSGKSRIVISPAEGFKIQKLKDGTTDVWEDVLSEDTEGKIIAKSIKLETSDIGGWTTTADGLSSPTGDYINSNGTGKLSLLSWNNSSATFDGNIYANNLYWRYGEGSYASIFSNGTMGGSWLTNGSVGKAKLDTLWVNEIDGVIAKFNEIYADLITANVLKTKYLITDDGVFGGSITIGDDENNRSQIWSSKDYVDTQHQSVHRIHMWSSGGYEFSSAEGDALPCIIHPWIIADNGISSQDTITITSTQGDDYTVLEVDGIADFKKKVRFRDEIMVQQEGNDLYGTTYQETDIDGHHIKVVNGIIVEFT